MRRVLLRSALLASAAWAVTGLGWPAHAQEPGAAPSGPIRALTPEEEANLRANALGDPRELVRRLRGTRISEAVGVIQDAEALSSPLLVMVTTDRDEGRSLIAMSVNGRYLFRGVLYDVWTGRLVRTMSELREVNGVINFEMIGINGRDLDPFVVGRGPTLVRVFADPLCPYSKGFFQQLLSDPRLLTDYTYEIYLVPFLGEQSIQAVRGLSCTRDREGALDILLSGDNRAALNLGAQFTPENCNPEPIMRRLIVSQQVGVSGVPYFIRNDGVPFAGLPPNLAVWLRGAG